MPTNAIARIDIIDRVLVPAQAEIWVRVALREPSPAAEVRGRLTGPRIRGSSTVEVAYPLRPLPQHVDEPASTITRRVVIPESSFWDTESPFLYDGLVELWEAGKRLDQKRIRHGLRTLTLGPQGVRLNGQLQRLTGLHSALAPADAALPAGHNLVLAPVHEEHRWDDGDCHGNFMLGWLQSAEQWPMAWERADHPCSFGLVVSQAELATTDLEELRKRRSNRPFLLGAMLSNGAASDLPSEIDFVVCSARLLPALPQSSRVIVLHEDSATPASDPRIIGTILCPRTEP